MKNAEKIALEVQNIYNWLEKQLISDKNCCKACGKCCDFGKFGHKLYVSSPEMVYFSQYAEPKRMSKVCPYLNQGKCDIYEHRFAGCRIFNCSGDEEFQSRLSEQALSRLKKVCIEFGLQYSYCDLENALNNSNPTASY